MYQKLYSVYWVKIHLCMGLNIVIQSISGTRANIARTIQIAMDYCTTTKAGVYPPFRCIIFYISFTFQLFAVAFRHGCGLGYVMTTVSQRQNQQQSLWICGYTDQSIRRQIVLSQPVVIIQQYWQWSMQLPNLFLLLSTKLW